MALIFRKSVSLAVTRVLDHGGKRLIHNLSPRELAVVEDRLVSVVGDQVHDPLLKTSLRSLGWIDNRIGSSDRGIRLQLRLPTLLHPSLSRLKQDVKDRAQDELDRIAQERKWESKSPLQVDVQVTAVPPQPVAARRPDQHDDLVARLGPGLCHIAHFLAVYSCKGGVGKSTVAVNLAYELARMGGRIGLLDVDIYGPSLPVLLHPSDPTVRRSPLGEMVLPITHSNVKIMSLGFVSPNSGVPGSGPGGGAAMMRGPMAGRVVTQLLKGTDWGDLDVLILDLPPGTGDVQLAVCQELELSGAVAVTTPSIVAETDHRKGVQLLDSMGVPTLATVDNMAYFDCEGGTRHYPFGKVDRASSVSKEATGVNATGVKSSNIFQLPISSETNKANDTGTPICLSRPKEASDELTVFENLANAVSTELLLLQHNTVTDGPQMVSFENSTAKYNIESLHMSVDEAQESFLVRLYSETGATQLSIPAYELKRRDPKTGEKIETAGVEKRSNRSSDGIVELSFHEDSRASGLFPARVEKRGHYGYAVEWADGGTVIYSLPSIIRAAGGNVVDTKSL